METNNILLAEFLGWEKLVVDWDEYIIPNHLDSSNNLEKSDGTKHTTYCTESFKFHNDWNWLMSVVDKIESLHYLVNISSAMVYINGDNGIIVNPINVYKEGGQTKHKCIYEACVQFVNWFNQQK